MKTNYYTGARLFDQGCLLDGFALHVENDKTVGIVCKASIPDGAPVTELDGGILTPGFVETQANGGGGVLVNEDFSHEGLAQVATAHRQFGTVAMLPTFITDKQTTYHRAIESITDAVKNGIKGIVGGHFEGPFINPEKKGTHNPKFIRQPDDSDFACFKQYAEYLQNSIISVAPEMLEVHTVAQLKNYFPQINMAHSQATHDDLSQARAEGLTGVTHLYNAMRPMTGRDPGPIGSAAELGLYCGIIADTVHSHPYALAQAYRSLGDEKLMLVTDSMHTIGVPEVTDFDLMGIKVFVKGDRLVNEHGALAGANVTLLQCLQNAVLHMHADIHSALKMAVSTPANYIGCPDLAKIIGRDIDDVIHLDSQLQLKKLV